MKRGLVDVLACPVCKGKLELKVMRENEEDIVAGSLCCTGCNRCYPIVDTIPHLLPMEQCSRL